MPTLATKFNWGAEIMNVNQVLYNQLNDSYSSIARITNLKSTKTSQTTNPPSDSQINANYDIGDIWVNTSTNAGYLLTSRTSANAVTWTLIT